MNAMQTLNVIAARVNEKLNAIRQTTLQQWLATADTLGVAKNDRDHAAKILAIRELKVEGVIK